MCKNKRWRKTQTSLLLQVETFDALSRNFLWVAWNFSVSDLLLMWKVKDSYPLVLLYYLFYLPCWSQSDYLLYILQLRFIFSRRMLFVSKDLCVKWHYNTTFAMNPGMSFNSQRASLLYSSFFYLPCASWYIYTYLLSHWVHQLFVPQALVSWLLLFYIYEWHRRLCVWRIKYSISAIADKGLKKPLFTSARLKKGEVLYLESRTRR